MKVSIKEIENTLQGVATKHGLPMNEAKILINEYLDGELQGKRSHGLAAFISLANKLPIKHKPAKILRRSDSFIYVDGNNNNGVVLGVKFAAEAIKLARSEGFAGVAIKNMHTWLRPGTIAATIADKGMVGFVINNGGVPMVAPPGGVDPMVGTNPIGIGIPSSKGPIVTDMATSSRAWGEVREATRLGKKLPPNAYLDDKGKVTLDPKKAYSALATGDYKGFALGLFIEVMCGAFLGMPMGPKSAMKRGDYRTSAKRGGIILVFNPAFTSSKSSFLRDIDTLVSSIRKAKPRKGQKVSLPGDRSSKTRKQNLKRGYLDLEPELWQQLQAL